MFDKCPFFPNEINPCELHQCQFACEGGCAISLAAYGHDAFEESKEINDKINDITNTLNDIENQIRQLKH